MASLFWLAEFALESSGAFFAFRRNLRVLAALLGFRALADVITRFLHGNAYGYAWWTGQALQYLFLCWIACQVAARFLSDRERLRHVLVIAALLTGIAIGAFQRGETWASRFLDAEISASCLLVLALGVAWIMRTGVPEKPWDMIAAGLITSVGGNAVCAALWKVLHLSPPIVEAIYPIPALAALLLWNWAGWRDYQLAKKTRLAEEVLEDQKFKPVGVKIPKIQSRMVN